MKSVIVLFLLCSTLFVNAQEDTLGIQVSDSTGLGTPDGKSVRKELGTAGGRVVSEDGRIELIFPEGALTASTVIGIQPTTNLAPNGTGKAYWFEPTGIQFKKPVQLIFHYTDEESEVCPPEWMTLGTQDHKGKWTFIEYDEWDSTAKTLKGFIYHFSGISNLNDVQIKAYENELRVTKSTMIELVDLSRLIDETTNALAEVANNAPVLWYVNSILNGNAHTGTLRIVQIPGYRTYRGYKTKAIQGEYTAPAFLPKMSTVIIWAELYRKKKGKKMLLKRLKCKIDISDFYALDIIHQFTGRIGVGSKLSDAAYFVVEIKNRSIKIRNIQNHTPIVTQEGQRAGCKEKHFVDGALGPVHITEGIKEVRFSKDYPVEIYFEFSTPTVLFYKFQYQCRGGTRTELTPIFDKSLPQEINFIANGQAQTYNIYIGSETKYKLIVTPYGR